MALKIKKQEDTPVVEPDVADLPKDPSDVQLTFAAKRYIEAVEKGGKIDQQIDVLSHEKDKNGLKKTWDSLHDQLEQAYDAEFKASEDLVVMLLRRYRNQSMISKALDEMAQAVKVGF